MNHIAASNASCREPPETVLMGQDHWDVVLGRMTARPGKRAELIAALKESARDVPGKLLYLIQLEEDNADAFWINEVWASKAAYEACLAMPKTGDWGAKLAPLLAGIEHRTETMPIDYPGNQQ